MSTNKITPDLAIICPVLGENISPSGYKLNHLYLGSLLEYLMKSY